MTHLMNDHPIAFWATVVAILVLFLAGFGTMRAKRELRDIATGREASLTAADRKQRREQLTGMMFLLLVGGAALLGMFVGALLFANDRAMAIGALAGLLVGLSLFGRFLGRLYKATRPARKAPPPPPPVGPS
jgi:hypothetical protein